MLKRLLALAALIPALAFANATTCMTDQAKKDFVDGVNLAANTYKMSIVSSVPTIGTATTTWASISANEITCTGTCTGWSAGGWTLATRSSAIASNHACIDYSTKSYSASNATMSGGRAAVIYNATTGNVVSIHCLDGTTQGSACGTSGDLACTSGTCTVTLPTNVICAN